MKVEWKAIKNIFQFKISRECALVWEVKDFGMSKFILEESFKRYFNQIHTTWKICEIPLEVSHCGLSVECSMGKWLESLYGFLIHSKIYYPICSEYTRGVYFPPLEHPLRMYSTWEKFSEENSANLIGISVRISQRIFQSINLRRNISQLICQLSNCATMFMILSVIRSKKYFFA